MPEVYLYDLSLRKAMDAAKFSVSLVDLSPFFSTCALTDFLHHVIDMITNWLGVDH